MKAKYKSLFKCVKITDKTLRLLDSARPYFVVSKTSSSTGYYTPTLISKTKVFTHILIPLTNNK